MMIMMMVVTTAWLAGWVGWVGAEMIATNTRREHAARHRGETVVVR
jgi:hypothetical protein